MMTILHFGSMPQSLAKLQEVGEIGNGNVTFVMRFIRAPIQQWKDTLRKYYYLASNLANSRSKNIYLRRGEWFFIAYIDHYSHHRSCKEGKRWKEHYRKSFYSWSQGSFTCVDCKDVSYGQLAIQFGKKYVLHQILHICDKTCNWTLSSLWL